MANFKKTIYLFILPLVFICATNCGSKKTNYKISFECNRVVFENKPNTINSENDFVSKVYATRTGYLFDESKITVTINNTVVSSSINTWSYNDSTFTIFKQAITGNIKVAACADASDFNINYTYDASAIHPVGILPTKINSKDLNVKFEINSDCGLDVSIKMNGNNFNDYCVKQEGSINNNVCYSLFIENKYIENNLHITLTSISGGLTLSRKALDIINYDTFDIYCYDPSGSSVAPHASSDAYIVSKSTDIANKFTISSNSNKTISNSILTFSGLLKNISMIVTIRHPRNLSEALDSVTLGFINGNNNFAITFAYNNNESFIEFTNHLELMTYMAGNDGISATYSKGNNITNIFKVIDISPHGRSYATNTTKHENYYYNPIVSGNYRIRKNDMVKREADSTLPIDRMNKSITVYNSEELFWAVEHGYIPLFNNTDSSLKAKNIYNIARTICLNEVNDIMDNFEKSRQLFDYLESIITYDYYVAEYSETTYPTWIKYSVYFLDGVFLNDGVAVCDGFSKAYSLLGGIERVPIIRSSGVYNGSTGHAWNYVQLNDLWYLVCPTWAKISVNKSDINIYKSNFAVHHYDSFLTSKNYFADNGMAFTDDNFPEIIKETSPYSENLAMIDTFIYNGNTYNFYIDSYDKLLKVFEKCHDCGLDKQKYALTFKVSDIDAFYNDKTHSGWLYDVLYNSRIRSYYNNSGIITSKASKLAIVTLS